MTHTKTTTSTRVDLIIVGGGLVGCALALAVAQNSSLQIAVLDASHTLPDYQGDALDPRVVALSRASSDFLHSLNVWQAVLAERACAYTAMEVWDTEGNGRIRFDCRDQHWPELGHIVENSVLLKAMRRLLATLPQVHWLAPVHPTDWQSYADKHQLGLSDGSQWQCSLLIAADGAQSQLRQWAGTPIRQWEYGHSAIVTSVRTQLPHGFAARQAFSHDGPLAFLPLIHGDGREEGYFSSIVWSLQTAKAQAMMQLDDAQFSEQLARAFEHHLGAVTWVDKRLSLSLCQRHAIEYGRPGFALVGDAAHSLHPLAGQGANLGFYDARALAEEITRAHRRRVPLDHPSLIQRYQNQRQVHNLTAMATMEGFKRLFGMDHPALLTLRNRGMTWVDNAAWLKRRLMEAAAGL